MDPTIPRPTLAPVPPPLFFRLCKFSQSLLPSAVTDQTKAFIEESPPKSEGVDSSWPLNHLSYTELILPGAGACWLSEGSLCPSDLQGVGCCSQNLGERADPINPGSFPSKRVLDFLLVHSGPHMLLSSLGHNFSWLQQYCCTVRSIK